MTYVEGDAAGFERQRIGDKFGPDVLDTVLAVTHRRVDDDGIELSHEEKRDDYLERLQALVAVPITIVSTGPDRGQTIMRQNPFG